MDSKIAINSNRIYQKFIQEYDLKNNPGIMKISFKVRLEVCQFVISDNLTENLQRTC